MYVLAPGKFVPTAQYPDNTSLFTSLPLTTPPPALRVNNLNTIGQSFKRGCSCIVRRQVV